MNLTQTDYYRDAVAMAIADKLPRETIKQANLLSQNGEQFNWAIWASAKLAEIERDREGR